MGAIKGNPVERGFAPELDSQYPGLSAVAVVETVQTCVIVDPSHATGYTHLVAPIAKAAVAAVQTV